VVPTDNDSIIEVDGIKFIVDKELEKSVRGVAVEYRFGTSGKVMVVLPLSYSSSSCR
jgi:Fe-S cluster assembly iron-binding protein IscA